MGYRVRPQRSFSSSSNQSKNSYYGIVAQYRKRRLQRQDSYDGKNSSENSVSVSGSDYQPKLIKKAQSQNYIRVSGSFD